MVVKPTVASKIGSATKLLTYAENVVKKSTENATLFPDATEQIAALQTALEAYRDGLTEARYRDMRQVVIKDQHADNLRYLLNKYALHVENVAEGDPNMILAAGFIPSKSTVQPAVGISPKPSDLRVEVKHPGTNSVQVQVKSWSKARFYQFEFRKAGSMNDWTPVLSTKSRFVIQGLEYLQEYEFRVTYLGTDPTPNYSNVVRCAVV